MTRNVSKTSLEKPLLGAVLCCTSITPEDRTRLAEYAEQMGAEHKLDLTSDVTHLLVGFTDTPKYQYVAREREDVKVLRPEWIEAVRECWMEDKPLDMNALQAEYRVPTLAGLKICITGFDDLSFRAQLQRNVIANGGEYTGDLTKEVTHLIAAKPEGKKYEYATLWQKKVVSLQWYKDTLDRGMQLDETSYHPTRPAAEQGVGAWNRQEQKQPIIGKRLRDDQPAQEPIRKLRRTASAKLGSQTNDMWGDITRQASLQETSDTAVIRSSKSMSAIREDKQTAVNQQPRQQKDDSLDFRNIYFQGLYFVAIGFDQRKEAIILRTLQGAGAEILNSVTELVKQDGAHTDNSFLIMPHQTNKAAEVTQLQNSTVKPSIVTELWLERCMLQKAFIKPSQYPLGGLMTRISAPNIENFTINATGFQSIETLHIAKTVAMTGAKYVETFTAKVNVLVCNSINLNNQKIFHAKEWQVPVVSESWLCAFLVSGSVPDYNPYLIEVDSREDDDLEAELKQKRQERYSRQKLNVSKDEQDDLSKQSMTVHPQSAETSFHTSKGLVIEIDKQEDGANGKDPYQAEQQKGDEFPSQITALREVAPNSPSRRSRPTNPSEKKPLFRTYDGADNTPEERYKRSEQDVQPSEESTKAVQSKKFGQDAASINSAIEDLLNMKSKAKANTVGQQAEPSSKKKRLLGRALSNLSNASHNSRRSRASSIDSLNTDGVGSEIAPLSGKTRTTENATLGQKTSTVQSRIQSKPSSAGAPGSLVQTSIDLSDPNLLRDDYAAEEEAPQMTQLGYEDSEEAMALRERLAEKRRARSRLGQEQNDAQPEVGGKERETPKQKQKQRQVIKDDDLLEAAGWGGGRRTRAKNRSTDLKDLDMF